jgi:hypothetical protein
VAIQSLNGNPVEFMLHGVSLLLESLGLQPYIACGYLRTQPPDGLVQVVQRCTGLLEPVFSRHTRKADFPERFLHLFSNCTVAAADSAVVNSLLLSQLWKTLAERHPRVSVSDRDAEG